MRPGKDFSEAKQQLKPFSLLIKPASADCNLRCAYCFYLDRARLYPGASRHRMPAGVLDRMIAAYMASDQPEYVFCWQGGEPTLMGLDFFKRVTQLQQQHGRAGAAVANGIQTNGLLIDDEFARHFSEYNFLVGVSLDGPEEMHDRYRRLTGGAGSHAHVMNALRVLKRHNVEHNILTLVNNINVMRPLDLYRYLCDQGLLFHQYIECVEFDRAGRPQPFSINGEQWGDFLCAIFDEWYRHDTRRVSIRLFDSIINMMVNGTANICAAAADCRQYFVIEYSGDVYPCDFFVSPELKLGNIMSEDWHDFQCSPVYLRFGGRKRRWADKCGVCEFLRYCAGDCPKNRDATGPRLSLLCSGWLQFYNHTIGRFKQLAEMIKRERSLQRPEDGRISSKPLRVGRNEPCPCGSGKKYKRCCGCPGARS